MIRRWRGPLRSIWRGNRLPGPATGQGCGRAGFARRREPPLLRPQREASPKRRIDDKWLPRLNLTSCPNYGGATINTRIFVKYPCLGTLSHYQRAITCAARTQFTTVRSSDDEGHRIE